MPKATFHNLPEDKKRLLIEAIQIEFSRVPFFEASISNMIKTAKIPRGSFYQYFEDKEDAFFYLLNKLTSQSKSKFLWVLKKHDGDLFEAMPDFFQAIIDEEVNIKFMRNAFLNMNHKIEGSFSEIFANEDSMEQFQLLSEHIDRSRLNISTNEELFHVMKIVSAVTIHNLIERFSYDISTKKALEHYLIQLNLLKKGLSRNKGEL